MKKTSTIIKERVTCDIDILINNTAYIKSVTGKTGLLNIKTNRIIGEMDNYYTVCYLDDKFYYQEKQIEKSDEENYGNSRKIIRIYDALNEKMVVDGLEAVEKFGSKLIALKSPVDGKIHLFDKYACRRPTNIFDLPLDNVEKLYNNQLNDIYLVVTINGKKGLYHYNDYKEASNLVKSIEFDDIEILSNIIVYTKDKQKYFEYTDKFGKPSSNFDDITIDENNKDIAYCKKDNKTYVYNTEAEELLLSTDSDEIKKIYIKWDGYNDYHNGEFFFEIMKEGKLGVISAKINNKIRRAGTGAKVTLLLQPNYDEIKRDDGVLYLKKDGKMGLFIGDSHHNQIIEPKYDNIDCLGYNYFALYTNGFCDIGKVILYNPFKASITNCEITEDLDNVLIYKKNDKFGLLFPNCDSSYQRKDIIIPPDYDNISNVAGHYFVLEKNNKKGLMQLGKIIIPIEYDEINFGGLYRKHCHLSDAKVLYLALKKGNKYELAKMRNLQYVETDVEFVGNQTFDQINLLREIIVFKDKMHSYIYDYNEKLLKTLSVNASITSYERPSKNADKDYFYGIDDVYYYYKDSKFEEVYTENHDCYLTTYDTDTDSFVVKTYNEDEHSSFCSVIDSQEDAEAERSLIEMSEKGIPRKKYPTLVLKRINKQSN